MGVWLGHRIADAIEHARHADYAASAELLCQLQRGERLTAEPLFRAAYHHAVREWWDQVSIQIDEEHLDAVHAVRRMRVRARHYLTAEPGAARPGTLIEHALAHTARAAARHFLAVTAQILTEQRQADDETVRNDQQQPEQTG